MKIPRNRARIWPAVIVVCAMAMWVAGALYVELTPVPMECKR